MELDLEKVYLARTPIHNSEAPFETYRELACRTLSALAFPLPAEGTVLIKPNATVFYPPDKRVITHPGYVGGLLDAFAERGVRSERLVVADGQSGEHPALGRIPGINAVTAQWLQSDVYGLKK